MKVEFAFFNKNRNSTLKCPDILYQDSWAYDVVLKDTNSVFSPVIVLEGWATIPNLTQHIYCRIKDFKRCYFVEDIVLDGSLAVFSLSVDVMGSFSDEIKNLRVFATRAESQYNGWYIDSFVQPQGYRWQKLEQFASVYTSNYTEGFYVVGLVNDDENQVGAVSYYVFTVNGFKSFCAQIFGTGDYAGIDTSNIDMATYRAIFNPMQYVTSCKYIPQKNYQAFCKEAVTSLKFGWYSVNNITNCWRLNEKSNEGYQVSFKIFKHPATSDNQQYLNIDPYMQISIIFPPYGCIPLDTTKLITSLYLVLQVSVDPITAVGTLTIWGAMSKDDLASYVFIDRVVTELGVDVQLAQVSRDNYAIQTAIAQRDANVINAMYNVNLTDIAVGALYGASKYLSASKSTSSTPLAMTGMNTVMGMTVYRPATQNDSVSLGGLLSAAAGGALNPPKTTANVKAARVAGAESIVKAQQPQVTKMGNSSGGVSQYGYANMIIYDYYDPSERDIKANGYPLMKNVYLYNMNGYVQCAGVKIERGFLANCLQEEREYIRACLEGGCYIE